MPAIGAKECIFNLSLAFLDPGDVALASDPGYPVYTGGPLMAGGEPYLMGLEPELGFAPDLGNFPPTSWSGRGRCSSTTPTTRRAPSSRMASSRLRSSWRAPHDMLVVHDNAYSETTFDGYVAPSFLATPGGQGRRRGGLLALQGLQHDRMALRGDRRQRRGDRPVLEAEVEHRLGPVRGRPAGRRRRPGPGGRRRRQRHERGLRAPARPGVRRARPGGVEIDSTARGRLRVGARPRGVCVRRGVLRARAGAGRRRDLSRRRLWPQRRGFLPDLADDARRPPDRGRRAPQRSCSGRAGRRRLP